MLCHHIRITAIAHIVFKAIFDSLRRQMTISEPILKELQRHISQGMQARRRNFHHRLKRIKQALQKNKPMDKALAQLQQDVLASKQQRQSRLAQLPTINYPEDLPVSQKKDDIKEAIKHHQVVVIAGETGSGKTTQIPKICLELGRGIEAMIGHTQPRRIAARSVAARIADELQSPLGKDVGYKIRFSDQTQSNTYIKLMTDGILLAEIQHDPLLMSYDTIIIDEAHERSLNIDFLLGYLKNILPKRPTLKIIITSATINTERFSTFFNGAPIIEVSGRSYPVDIEYRPLLSDDENELTLNQAIIDAVDEAARFDAMGDILVFLPGEREIRDVSHALHQHEIRNTEILPLFSRLSPAEQDKIFKGHSGRRIVLATNVAETSLTVPGIRFVIDAGLARISRYSVRNKVQQLPIEPISQASANQRAGRCGRVAAGVCFRLYSEEQFNNRPEHTDPEIRRTNLANVILQMTSLGLGDIDAFPFMEPPEKRSIQDGYRLLEELQSMDEKGQLTTIGKQLTRLPVDPRLGRMLVQADKERALAEVLVIVSALSVQDPKVRPSDAQQKADEKHAIFTEKTSDFLSWVKLWDWYHEQAKHLSNSKLRKTCQQHFISYLSMREWLDLHGQLLAIVRDLKMTPNQIPAEPDAVHKSILSGLLSHIALRQEETKKSDGKKSDGKRNDKGFIGARNLQVQVFPGSPLSKKPPKWLMAAFLVETSKLFARCIAPIDPAWLEQLGSHLFKRTYSEPHWSKKRAQVNAYETVTLYGLPIISRRIAHFGPVDPVVSRELLIRHALVMFEFHSFGKFFKHNQKLLQDIESLEAKARRKDLLSDEQTRFEFFDAIIPEGIYSGKLFEQWRKKEERNNPNILFLNQDVLLHQDANLDDAAFPNKQDINGLKLKLGYHFDPTHHADGITTQVPLVTLGQLDSSTFEWLVPGLLEEKIVYLIKSLPKALRKNFVPAPQYAKACAEQMPFGQGSLLLELARQLKRMTGVDISSKDWNVEQLPEHLKMKFNLLDDKGDTIATSNVLADLQKQYAHQARQGLQQATSKSFHEIKGITRWEFEEIPPSITQQKNGMQLLLFPALVDKQTSVTLSLFESEDAAEAAMQKGLRRLFMLTLHQQVEMLQKKMEGLQEITLLYATFGNSEALRNDIIAKAFEAVFMAEPLPRNQHDFEARLDAGRANIVAKGNALAANVRDTLKALTSLQQAIKEVRAAALHPVVENIQAQVARLIYPGFVQLTPANWLPHLPRFIAAAQIRLEKAGPQLKQDQQNAQLLQKLWASYEAEKAQREKHHQSTLPLTEYRWLLEELCVSLFAQSLKTSVPISAKRLEKLWQDINT